MTRLSLKVAGAATLGVALASCSSSPKSSYSPAVTTAPAIAAPTPAAAAPAAPATAGGTITVTETEFSLGLATKTFAAGTYTIDAKNAGHIEHALEIKGPGISNKATAGISPGLSAEMSVTLSKGSYEIWCPVDDHKMEGMDTTVTVT